MFRLVIIAGLGLVASPVLAAPPLSSQDFLETIGVDTHMAYTDGAYANVPQVIKDIQYLGLAAVRDGISNGYDPITGKYNGSAPITTYEQLAAAHVKFTFLSIGGGGITTAILNSQIGLMQQVETATPGSVFTIEGPNEINNFPITWNGAPDATCPEELSDAEALQKTLFADVKSNAALKGVKATMFTGANAYLTQDQCQLADHPDVGTVRGYALYDNQHPYPQNGTAPDPWVNPANAVPGNTAPLLYTETGYNTAGGIYAGVNEYVQGMYGLDLYFDAAFYGVFRTYWYDLLDAYAPGSPQGDDYYGLFDYLGNAKALAFNLHNLHIIMADHGKGALQVPGFTASGLPADGKTMALGRKDGSSGDFVLWAEPPLWNPATGTPIQPVTEAVQIKLGQSYATVEVFDPTLGAKAVQSLSDVSQVTVMLADHPLIVRARLGAEKAGWNEAIPPGPPSY